MRHVTYKRRCHVVFSRTRWSEVRCTVTWRRRQCSRIVATDTVRGFLMAYETCIHVFGMFLMHQKLTHCEISYPSVLIWTHYPSVLIWTHYKETTHRLN